MSEQRSLNELRQWAPDHVAAAAFAPATCQDDLLAIAGLVGALRQIIMTVADPMAGEVRLQWWREVVLGSSERVSSGDERADAAAAVFRKLQWPEARFHRFMDAHADALYADPPTDETDAFERLDARFAEPMRMAAAILRLGQGNAAFNDVVNETDDVYALAGRAYGLMTVVLDQVQLSQLGRSPQSGNYDLVEGNQTPESDDATTGRLAGEACAAVQRVRPSFSHMPRHARVAILPVVVVEPQFGALQRQADRRAKASREAAGGGLMTEPDHLKPIAITPLSRLLRMTWAYASGRL